MPPVTSAAEADAAAALAAEVPLVPLIARWQDNCLRHRAPCAHCRADSPRARRLAAQGLRVCECESDPCSCGLAMLLVAEGASVVYAVHIALAMRDAIALAYNIRGGSSA